VQTHHYGSRDLVPTLARAQAQKSAYGKPHVIGEIGADAGGPRCNDDPRGYQIHDPLWISLVTGGAGTAQPWWWDNCIAPKNLYGVFTPAAKFVAAIDFPTEDFQVVSARLEWLATPEPARRKDLVIGGGPTSWEKSDFNQPRRVRVTSTGASGELPIAGLQHGLGGHRDKHNPVTFDINLPWAKRFEIEVGDVSGWGGANLRVTLDGKTALNKEFADPDGSKDTRTLTQYAGSYGVDLTAGAHTVVVENTGPDWFTVQYRIRDALEPTGPAALAWALAGKTTAMAWARHEDRSWHTLCVLKQDPGPVPASVLVVPGLSAGSWEAEIWDTWNGSVLQRQTVSVPPGGEARVGLEAFEHDVAVKLLRRN
jgi:hypothetical protein